MLNRIKRWIRRRTVQIESFENKRNLWQWRLLADNGEILSHSEEYTSRKACKDTMKMLIGKKIR